MPTSNAKKVQELVPHAAVLFPLFLITVMIHENWFRPVTTDSIRTFVRLPFQQLHKQSLQVCLAFITPSYSTGPGSSGCHLVPSLSHHRHDSQILFRVCHHRFYSFISSSIPTIAHATSSSLPAHHQPFMPFRKWFLSLQCGSISFSSMSWCSNIVSDCQQQFHS